MVLLLLLLSEASRRRTDINREVKGGSRVIHHGKGVLNTYCGRRPNA
jgi:hypothetical protein